MGGTKVREAWKTIKNISTDRAEKAGCPVYSVQEWEEHYKKLLSENRNEYKHDII